MANPTITPAASAQLTKGMTAEIVDCPHYGQIIELTGKRGACYQSIPNRHDGFHRFIEPRAPRAKFAIVDGMIALASEV